MHSTVTKLLAPLDSISSYEPAGSGGAAGGDEDSASSSIGAGEQAGPGQARSVFSQAKWFRVVAEDGLAISEGEDPSSGRKELKYAQGELVEALQVRRAGGRPERHRQGGPSPLHLEPRCRRRAPAGAALHPPCTGTEVGGGGEEGGTAQSTRSVRGLTICPGWR
jgi:hypothetical protein